MNDKKDFLIISLDVEPDCDTSWNRSYPFAFSSVTYGIPKILRPIWDTFGIKPIYFVSPEVVMNETCCEVLRDEIKKGAIIGAHLHSEFIEPNALLNENSGMPSFEFPCYAHPTNIEFRKIKNLTRLIKKNLGVRPKWYRAARFGADLDTIKIISKLGYRYDSSVTPEIDWREEGGSNHHFAPKQPYPISKKDFYKPATTKKDSFGVTEFPVTISGKRFGFFGKILPDRWFFHRWLRPTHMSVYEMKKLVNEFYAKHKSPSFVMMFHSMETMPGKTPFVRNRILRFFFVRRLKRIIEYILQHEKKKKHSAF